MDNIIDISKLELLNSDPHSIIGMDNRRHITRNFNYVPQLKAQIKTLQDEVEELKENPATPEMDKLNELEGRLATIESDVERMYSLIDDNFEMINTIMGRLDRNNIF